MAVLYELLAGGPAPAARGGSPRPPAIETEPPAGVSARRSTRAHGAAAATCSCAARTPARPARGARPRAATCCVRDGEIAEVGEPARSRRPQGAEVVDADGPARASRPSSTRTCTCARPAARTRRTSTPARAPPPPAATARSSPCRTPTRWWTRAPVLALAARARARAGARADRLPRRDHARAGRRASSPRWPSSPTRAPPASPTTACRCARAGVLRQALQYQRLAGRTLALHEEDPTLSGAGVMHEGAVSALLGLAGIPSISRVHDGRARRRARRATRTARIHIQHVSARETVDGDRARQGRRRADHRRGHARTTSCSPTRPCARSTRNFKMNPPLRSEADRQALIEALRTGALDCVATDHAPHAREEKEQPFELAPMGVDRARDRLRRAPHRPGAAGRDRRWRCWSSA